MQKNIKKMQGSQRQSVGKIACAVSAVALLLAACGLPRTGPTDAEIQSYVSSLGANAVALVPISVDVAHTTKIVRESKISSGFKNAPLINTDVIRPADSLSVSVYENVDDGVLSSGQVPADIVELEVDNAGFVFLPYVGRVLASGKTTEQLRRLIERKLEEQTPDPQVLVRRAPGVGSSVTAVGQVGAQGTYPLDITSRTISGLLAQAGGIVIPSDVAKITILRQSKRADIWANDLYSGNTTDIALRPGDRILVEEDPRQFVALGAIGGQTVVPFDSNDISLIEAMGSVGGLDGSQADPTGVFVFRNEDPEVISALALELTTTESRRIIYAIDMTNPESVFSASEFLIRDDDVIYVTEAPYTRVTKTLQALTGTINTAGSVTTLAE